MKSLILKHFPILNDSKLQQEIEDFGELSTIEEGSPLIKKGQYPKFIPIIISGLIKVNRIDDNGNEIFLYYLSAGDSCAMTLACCTGHKASKLAAYAEQDSTIIKIPVEKMDEWISKYPTWRNFVFDSLNNRITNLLNTIDEIAFSSLDERLIIHFNKIAELTGSKSIQTTHQHIASELNTSREVISRLLKKLETKGFLKLNRNKIELL